MRRAFAHDALVRMGPEADPQAIGAAVTVALCGHWVHEPPCPLAPHHTDASQHGDAVRVRVLFATEPGQEAEVRRRIEGALARGRLTAERGTVTEWQLVSSGAGALLPLSSTTHSVWWPATGHRGSPASTRRVDTAE